MAKFAIRRLWLVTALTTIGGLIQGFDVSSMSAIIGTPQYTSYFHHPDSTMQGGITASMAGGSLLGSLFSSVVSDRIGRRDTMFGACIVFVIGSILMSAVQNLSMLIVSRIVNGFAVGMLTSQGPILLAELAPPNKRGRLIAVQQWNITWGILIMYFVSYGSSFMKSNASFRLPWALQMIPAIVLMACIPFMPRSPRWLAGRDRWDEAIQVLADVHARGNRLDPLVVAQIREIREYLTAERESGNGAWSDLLKRENFARVSTSILTHIWAQYTGQNALMYYIVYIFQMAGLKGQQNLLISSIQYIIQVVALVPGLIFMDRWPRRYVMLLGSFVLGATCFTVSGVMASYGHKVPGGLDGSKTVTWVVDNKAAARGIIACAYIFVATYATTWGPVGWIYPPEVIPFSIRSKVVSCATAANWAMNFSLTFFTPPAFQNIQWRTFLIFGSFCVASFITVFLFFQETRGKSLEEMDHVFRNESVWAFLVDTKKPSAIEVDVQQAAEDKNDTIREELAFIANKV